MRHLACSFALLLVPAAAAQAPMEVSAATSSSAEFLGAWSGQITHDGDSVAFAVEIEPAPDGQLALKVTLPALHVARAPFGTAKPELAGAELRLGPFRFVLDREAGTLSGTIPEGLAPVYRLPFVLRRVPKIEETQRAQPAAPPAQPVWTYEAGAALWPGPSFADGRLYFGGEDGVLHALDARDGQKRWTFRAGGPIRTRPTVAGDTLYFAADDGFVYALTTAAGGERWRVKLTQKPIERLPFDNPKSRYDRFGADVAVAEGRLFVGTHDGKLIALDPAGGAVLWEFAAGDSVLGAPAVADGRLYAGSFDGHVYALAAATGRLLWKRDTRGAIVSTPAVAGNRLVVGNRSYDLLGLDAAGGEIAWKRYIWFSWVESSATIRDGVAYVGSSDAAAVFAFDVGSGRSVWKADVFGWAWGQPAVTAERVYVGTSSTPGYMGGAHRGGAMAIDRATGAAVWRFAVEPGAEGETYGFPGSPAVGDGLVFFTGLDGRARAFRP
jgi:outer membrane protein assembly factor BamB